MRTTHLLLFFIMNMVCNPLWATEIVIPDCHALERWTANIPMAKGGMTGAEIKKLLAEQKKQADSIYSDENTATVFGIPYSKWTVKQGGLVRQKAAYCYEQRSLSTESRERILVAVNRLKHIRGSTRLPGQERYVTRSPSCEELKSWVKVLQTRQQIHSDPANYGKLKEIYAMQAKSLLADQNVIPYFGQPLNSWRQEDFHRAGNLIENCWSRARRNRDEINTDKLRSAMGYLATHARGKTTRR